MRVSHLQEVLVFVDMKDEDVSFHNWKLKIGNANEVIGFFQFT
jgi:hypothetical protein